MHLLSEVVQHRQSKSYQGPTSPFTLAINLQPAVNAEVRSYTNARSLNTWVSIFRIRVSYTTMCKSINTWSHGSASSVFLLSESSLSLLSPTLQTYWLQISNRWFMSRLKAKKSRRRRRGKALPSDRLGTWTRRDPSTEVELELGGLTNKNRETWRVFRRRLRLMGYCLLFIGLCPMNSLWKSKKSLTMRFPSP